MTWMLPLLRITPFKIWALPTYSVGPVVYGRSVTRLGNLLDFGQLFKACMYNYFAQTSHIFTQFLLRCQNL